MTFEIASVKLAKAEENSDRPVRNDSRGCSDACAGLFDGLEKIACEMTHTGELLQMLKSEELKWQVKRFVSNSKPTTMS